LVRSKRDNDALNQLIADCVLYNSDEKEALEYIERRFGKAFIAKA
jgi:hypothetical protein